MLSVLARFRPTLRRRRGALALGGLLVLVVAALELALPWPLKVVVDDVLERRAPGGRLGELLGPLGERPVVVLALCATTLVLLAGLGALASYLSSMLLLGAGERIVADLRTETFAHLQRLSLAFHAGQRVGDLGTRMTSDINAVQALLVASFSTLVPNVALLVGVLLISLLVEPLLALLVLVVGPALFLVVRHYRDAIRQASREARLHEGHVASHVTETLTTIRLVQSFAGERRGLERFRLHAEARLSAGLRQVDLQSRMPAAVDLVTQVGRAAVLFLGGLLVLDERMTLGVLLVLLAYLQQLYGPMKALARLSSVIAKGQAGAERVDEVLRATVMIRERPDAVRAPPLRGDVELQDVHFAYDPDRPVLSGVSLHAPAGQVIALAGPTGAGKSSIVGLVPRLYDVTAGGVLVDGRDVRSFTLASLRKQVAVVLQDPLMVTGSILDNIAFGAPTASREDLLAAAQAAYVDEFVSKLPDGYDTQVAERGVTLSGGQRQRIAIARALATRAPIVVLDEPTSGLDAQSEVQVMRGLAALTAQRTVLVVAHRLSTLRDADRVYVIDSGRVVDSGTHRELAARPGRYRAMNELLLAR